MNDIDKGKLKEKIKETETLIRYYRDRRARNWDDGDILKYLSFVLQELTKISKGEYVTEEYMHLMLKNQKVIF